MAYDPGAIDATLAAAVGDEPALIAELREAFLSSAKGAVTNLTRAADSPTWIDASLRLKGLAASFGAVRLMALAGDAANAPVGDAETLRKLRRGDGATASAPALASRRPARRASAGTSGRSQARG